MIVLLLVGGSLAVAPGAWLAGTVRPAWAGRVTVAGAAGALALALAGMAAGGSRLDVAWLPSLGVRLSLSLDGLASGYALLATGVGLVVAAYATAYLPRHLAEHGRSRAEEPRFFALFSLFLAAMVGLATAQDLVVALVFFDVTTIASYFLIGYDRDEPSRRSALAALLVTGLPSFLFLAGAVALVVRHGTADLGALADAARTDPHLGVPLALVAIAALAKSAQVPLHFWLPRAMVAPTPVSAYLHSAAMVAAGVLLLTRLHPLVELVPPLGAALRVVGAASLLGGGLLALRAERMKELLAYSTIAHYGAVTLALGLGGAAGAGAAALYVLPHGAAKSALFLAAGAATQATGAHELDEVGGLARRMPALAAATAVAAASLAGLPLTAGFWKDERLYEAALEHGPWWGAVAAAGAALTVAYAWRFFAGVFLGEARGDPERVPRTLVWPVALLAVLLLAGGVFAEPLGALAAGMASAVGEATSARLHYRLAPTGPNLLALAAVAAGAAMARWSGLPRRAAGAFAAAGARAGPDRAARTLLSLVDRGGTGARRLTPESLPGVLAAQAIAAVALVAIAAGSASPRLPSFGPSPWSDPSLAIALAGLVATAALPPRAGGVAALVLALSAIGYGLALAFSFAGAPDVALVAVLVEIVSTLLILAIFYRFPREQLEESLSRGSRAARARAVARAAVASVGILFLLFTWSAYDARAPAPVGDAYLDLAERAHAENVVTAVLADFRGLDTAGETTVVFISLVGVSLLLGRGRRRA